MMTPTKRLTLILTLVTAAGLAACADAPTSPIEMDPAFAKGGGGGGVSVNATDPAEGPQGSVNLRVSIAGSGFAPGATAAWERDGVADPKIVTNATTFVSETELIADITIAEDADVDLYDVAVTVPGKRKKGIGVELFSVTVGDGLPATGLPLLEGDEIGRALGVNATGVVVGQSTDSETGVSSGVVWQPTGELVFLTNTHYVGSIADQGVILGENSFWLPEGDGWGLRQTLPMPFNWDPYAGGWDVTDSWAVGAGEDPTGQFRPLRWLFNGSSFQVEVIPEPEDGAVASWGHGINAHGHVVGFRRLETGNGKRVTEIRLVAFLWRGPGTEMVILPDLQGSTRSIARDINDAGVISGEVTDGSGRDIAVRWVPKTDGSAEYFPPEVIPYAAHWSTGDRINAAGQIIGTLSPNAGGSPVLGFVWDPSNVTVEILLPLPGFSESYARDISCTGLIVGESYSSSGHGSPSTRVPSSWQATDRGC